MDKSVKSTKSFVMTGVCGIYCGECECHKAKDDARLMEYLISKGMSKEALPCQGCRKAEGRCPAIGEVCETYKCAGKHGVDFCFECSEFPCDKLNPSADKANILPHNLKVFNLCSIKCKGLEAFVEGYGKVKEKYYRGEMAIGKGPQVR